MQKMSSSKKSRSQKEIKITHPQKRIAHGVTKKDIALYYEKISSCMLPYIQNRPLSLIRCQHGIEQACFFKKHPQTEEEKKNQFFYQKDAYFYVDQKEDIIYQAQMNTIEFHCWGCHYQNLSHPDMMVFDLDPDETISLSQLRQCVLHLKKILDDLHLISFLKTSGGKGYHVVVPFASTKSWTFFLKFAKQVAQVMVETYPDLYTINLRKKERKGKIFIDYLRNQKGATCVAPYSLRARNNLPISMPISWKDLMNVAPSEVTIKNYTKYLKKKVWNGFFSVTQTIK